MKTERIPAPNGAFQVPGLNAVDGEYRVYAPAGDFLALCAVSNGELRTVRSFFAL